MRQRIPGSGWLAVVLLLAVAACVVGIALARTLGLQYDEALFVPAAIDPDTRQFVTVRWGSVPIMLMDYIGAVKAWLYAPIFALFGVSIESIRIPMVLLFGIAVVLAGRFVARRSTGWAGAVAALLLVTEPAFTVMSRNDWGPVMIAGFLRIVLLGVLVALVTTRRRRWFVGLVLVVVVGTFAKLDFAVASAALIAAAVVAFLPEWRVVGRERPVRTVTTAVALVVLAAVAFVIVYLPARSRLPDFEGNLLARVGDRITLVARTFAGDDLAAHVVRGTLPVTSFAIPFSIAVVAVAAVVGALRSRSPRSAPAVTGMIGPGRATVFLALAGLFTLVGLIAIDQPAWLHHAASIWPYPWLAAATGLAFIVDGLRERQVARPVGIGAAVLAGALLVGTLGTQLGATIGFDRLLVETTARPPIWTFDTERAAEVIGAEAVAGPVVTADWGIGNQLIAFRDHATGEEIVELWAEFRVAPALEVFDAAGIEGPFVLVYHDDDSQVFPGTTQAARAVVAECLRRGGSSVVTYRGDDILVRDVSCPAA